MVDRISPNPPSAANFSHPAPHPECMTRKARKAQPKGHAPRGSGKRAGHTEPRKLTALQEQFCQEYLIDLNATQAAARAGFSDPNYGRQLLTNPNVENRITALMADRATRTRVTQDRVLEELADVAFTPFTDLASWTSDDLSFIPSDQLPAGPRRSVRSVKVKRRISVSADGAESSSVEMEITQHDKLSALDKLARHLGMYRPEEGTGRTSGLDALVELMAARKRQRDEERG